MFSNISWLYLILAGVAATTTLVAIKCLWVPPDGPDGPDGPIAATVDISYLGLHEGRGIPIDDYKAYLEKLHAENDIVVTTILHAKCRIVLMLEPNDSGQVIADLFPPINTGRSVYGFHPGPSIEESDMFEGYTDNARHVVFNIIIPSELDDLVQSTVRYLCPSLEDRLLRAMQPPIPLPWWVYRINAYIPSSVWAWIPWRALIIIMSLTYRMCAYGLAYLIVFTWFIFRLFFPICDC